MNNFKVYRCIKPSSFDDSYLELHHFCDSSEQAYGCCSYLRGVNKDGEICISLIISKSRVAPLKVMSLPRLELQSAVLAVEIDSILKNNLDIQFVRTFFWTDSQIVIKYIANETKRFKVFVSNRINKIRSQSDVSQWFHIAGSQNPADVLTRPLLNVSHMESWIRGPSFLSHYKSDWDDYTLQNKCIPEDDIEVKKSDASSFLIQVDLDNPIKRLIDYHSSWFNLKKAVAWLIRFRDLLLRRTISKNKLLSVSELKRAEITSNLHKISFIRRN